MFSTRRNYLFVLLGLIFSTIGIANSAYAFPNPPNAVSATDGELNTITVSWTAPSGGDTPTSYLVYRSTSNTPCGGSPIASVNVPTLTFVDSSFPNTNVFYYSLRSVNASAQQSNCSNTDSGYALGLPPPGSPDPVAATDDLLDKIAVSWNLPTNSQPFTSLRLYRTDSQGLKFCNGDLIENNLSAVSTNYNDFTATPGVAYFYALKSVGPTGISNCSSFPDSGRRLLPPPPNPPTNVMATDGTYTNKVVVTWVPPVSGGVFTNFKLHRSTNIATGCNSLHVDNISAGLTSLDDVFSVVPGVQYYYWMQAVGPDGTSECSILDPGHAAISPPENVQASDGTFPDKVLVTWNPPSLGGSVTGYNLYRSDTPQACQNIIATGLPSSPLSYNDTSVTPGKRYYYSLKSLSATGESVCSPVDPGHARLGPPISVSATDGVYPDKVRVTWAAPTSGASNVQGYKLYRNADCSGAPLATYNSPSTLSADDFTATPAVVYQYSVLAFGTVGDGVCSAPDPGYPFISPPENISATDGSFTDKVIVSWNPPSLGGNINGYDLYRNGACTGAPIASGLVNTSYADTAVVPGTVYTYSAKTLSPTGASVCSAIDTGYPQITPAVNVAATDGAFPDRVNVSWNAYTLGEPVTGYILYRDTTPSSCSVVLNSSLPAGSNTYSDLTAVPGTIYYYSVRTKAASGNSTCSNIDPGHAITQCSDNLDNDGDNLKDLSDPGCTSLSDNDESNIYICNDGLDNDGDGNADYPDDKGCTSPTDDSEKDPTYICDDGLDNDGDNKIDYRVDGLGDPGCSFPTDSNETDFDQATLRSPVFTKFNTFIGQWNFAELVNQGTLEKTVKVTVFNLFGQEMVTRTVVVPGQSEVDIDVNGLVQYSCDVLKQGCEYFQDLSATRGDENGLGRPDGIVDTYGLVKVEFDDSDPDQRLAGRISMYRPNIDGSFSFAFAREFRNPTKGQRTFAVSNTYDPRGDGNLVPNWAEVIALGKRQGDGSIKKESLSFTLKMYTQTGQLVDTRNFTLPGLGEFDYAAGHEFTDATGEVIESVYLIEVVPSDPDAEYLMSVARYSSNAPRGTDPATYNYALVLDGVSGSTQPQYAPVGSATVGVASVSSNLSTENWYESACVSATGCRIQVLFRNTSGTVIANQIDNYAPYSQIHLNAGAIIPKGTAGSVEVRVITGKTIGQSMSYVHGELNELQSGFASIARVVGKKSQAGSINTFLNMQNVLALTATSVSSTTASLNAKTFDGGSYSASVGLNSGGASSLGVTGAGLLGVPQNRFGAMLMSTNNAGQALAEVRRVRLDAKGNIDFVMPTSLK